MDFSSKPRSGDTLADEKRVINDSWKFGAFWWILGTAGCQLRVAESCASVRVLFRYRAYPSLPITYARNPALRPLRGLAHGLPYPAHFGADSHNATCRQK